MSNQAKIITYPPQRKTQSLPLRDKLLHLQDEATVAQARLGDLVAQVRAVELEMARKNSVEVSAQV